MAKRTLADSQQLTVSSPDDLDSLLEALSGTPASKFAETEGEHLFVIERLIVSPATGVFELVDDAVVGEKIEPGDLVGMVGRHEVRSPFAGELRGILALAGERIVTSQPVAWLESA